MTTVVIAIAFLLLFAFWFVYTLVAQDNRVVSREPSDFELAARRFAGAIQETQLVIGATLLPAFAEATRSVTQWNEAWARLIEKVEAEYGPWPREIPFLDWWTSVEHSTGKEQG